MGKEVIAYKAKRSDFKKDLNNANAGTPEGQVLIKQSVQETGFHRGFFADKNGYIGGGNKTFTAAEGESIEDVIVVETTGETPVIIKRMDFDLNAADPNNPARRAAYYDNITAIVDIELDPAVLMGDMAAGVDIESIIPEDLLGELLAGSDADALLGGGEPKEETPIPEAETSKAAELAQGYGIEVGQVWVLDSGKGWVHRVGVGDNTDKDFVDKVLQGNRVDLGLHDPQYGVNRDKGFGGADGFAGGNGKPIARRAYNDDWDSGRPVKATFDSILPLAKLTMIFGGNFFADILPQSTHWIVWDKLNTMPTFGDCELVWTNSPRKSISKITFEYNGLIGREKERYHPTQKPVGLYKLILSDYSGAGDSVLDCWLGSGTALVSCESLGRNCYGVEVSPGYIAVSIHRWEKLTNCKAVLENS